MRFRVLIATAVVSGGLAACSKPTAQAGTSSGDTGGARQIRLAEPAATDGAVVSDLEARQPLKPILVRRLGRRSVEPAVSSPSPVAQAEVPAAADAAPMPEMAMTTSSSALAPRFAGMRPMPVIPLIGSGHVDGMGRGNDEPGFQSDRSRGPILIRGGMGGIDDKCDLRGGHRGGIAINRSTPSFGGYPRGGIR